MAKVANIDLRKSEHLKINLEKDVRSGLTTGLEKVHFVHNALPEINLDTIDLSLDLFGKKLSSPILISSMTGGTSDAQTINARLAEAAQEANVALGVGSQRAAIENPDLVETYSITRKMAPTIPIFANLGAIQLNYGYTIDQCRRVVEMLEADGLILHLNPLQEALQVGGNTNFKDLAGKIELICRNLDTPVIAKEVGWGISEQAARILSDCGVSAIDVAGAGGTSWSQVEMYRAPDEFARNLAASFIDWGIPTLDSIINVKKVAPGLTIFASGGLTNGLDIAKCIAIGATLGGMAGPFLKAAAESSEAIVKLLKLTSEQIRVTLFAIGMKNLDALQGGNAVIINR